MDKGKNVALSSGSKVLNPFATPFEYVPEGKNVALLSSGFNEMNPFARSFTRPFEHAPEDDRSLFMTFSHGFPLAWFEIREYLTEVYGNCVEYVHNHRRADGRSAEFGKIVFTTSHMPCAIMQGREVVRHVIRNRPVWLKRFRPRIDVMTTIDRLNFFDN
ncbi:hypothetical protein Adt_44295 [Abeliophyllum distichum]|uniref:Uncharacterized protein n=1 Tax=Abeliophyllum distichum TaxID=126358 RepID=A0ABD1PAE9_9LAMI